MKAAARRAPRSSGGDWDRGDRRRGGRRWQRRPRRRMRPWGAWRARCGMRAIQHAHIQHTQCGIKEVVNIGQQRHARDVLAYLANRITPRRTPR